MKEKQKKYIKIAIIIVLLILISVYILIQRRKKWNNRKNKLYKKSTNRLRNGRSIAFRNF